MMNKLRMLQIAILSSGVFTGCSGTAGGGCCSFGDNQDNGDITKLQIIAPSIVYSKPNMLGSGYVVINNPTNMSLKNLHYKLINLIGGASGVEIDSASAANCSIIVAYSQCNVKITVPVGAVAGSFGFIVGDDTDLADNSLNKSANALVLPTQTVGVEQITYNSLSGADGITISYYHTVIRGVSYILVSGLIASGRAGNFNRVVLVNGSGVELPNQELIGWTSSAQGATFNILLPVPTGNNITQTVKVQTRQDDSVVSTATTSSTLNTKENTGIVEILPGVVYLTESYPEQIITLVNIGDTVAPLQQLTSNEQNVEVVFGPANLAKGAITTAVLKLKNKVAPAATGNVILTYNDGKNGTNTSGTVYQNVGLTPTPTPTPPVPTPAVPSAGLTAIFANNDNQFFTNTEIGLGSRQLTLTNIGNTNQTDIMLTLPPNFTLANGSINSCTISNLNGDLAGTVLTPGGSTQSCDVTVRYSNNVVVDPIQLANINISYKYNNGVPAPNPTIAGVEYRVTQATANLSISPANYDFGSILNNNSDTSSNAFFTISNTGDGAASSFSLSIAGTNSNMFNSNYDSITSGQECSAFFPSLPPNQSCKVNVKFGPTTMATAPASADLDIAYTAYTGQLSTTVTSNLSGASVTAASVNIAAPSGDGFSIGTDGSSSNPYTILVGNSGVLTYTYTNTGTQAANNFYVSNIGLPTGWTRSGGDCPTSSPGASLPNTGSNSCSVEFTINTTAGTSNFNQNVMTAHWTDSANPTGKSQTVSSSISYVTVTAPPNINITQITTWQTVMGNAYVFTVTMTGGSSTVSFANFSGLAGASLSPSSCTLDSTVPDSDSCVVMVTPYGGSGDYSYWNPSSIQNSSIGNEIIISTNTFSLDISADNGATINGQASPQTFNNISATAIAPYVYLPAPLVGAASANNVGITWGSGGNINSRFEEVDGGCAIKDNLTNLIWVKNLNLVNGGNRLSWYDALSIAASGTWCGQTAGTWRSPNVSEMTSLLNYGQTHQSVWLNTPIASGGAGFNNVQAGYYWTSSTYAPDYYFPDVDNGWYVSLVDDGFTGSDEKGGIYDEYRLFPVRDGQ